MTKQAAYARASTMGNLNRQVRVATGTSIETCHDPGQPSLPGEGQGKADSMALWTLISSEILKVHTNMCHWVEMTDVTGTISSRRVDDAYVDDTDTYATAPETNSPDEVIENLTDHTRKYGQCSSPSLADSSPSTNVCGRFSFGSVLEENISWQAIEISKETYSSKIKEDIHTKSNEWKQQNPIRA
jgi:hypothetical protein